MNRTLNRTFTGEHGVDVAATLCDDDGSRPMSPTGIVVCNPVGTGDICARRRFSRRVFAAAAEDGTHESEEEEKGSVGGETGDMETPEA